MQADFPGKIDEHEDERCGQCRHRGGKKDQRRTKGEKYGTAGDGAQAGQQIYLVPLLTDFNENAFKFIFVDEINDNQRNGQHGDPDQKQRPFEAITGAGRGLK